MYMFITPFAFYNLFMIVTLSTSTFLLFSCCKTKKTRKKPLHVKRENVKAQKNVDKGKPAKKSAGQVEITKKKAGRKGGAGPTTITARAGIKAKKNKEKAENELVEAIGDVEVPPTTDDDDDDDDDNKDDKGIKPTDIKENETPPVESDYVRIDQVTPPLDHVQEPVIEDRDQEPVIEELQTPLTSGKIDEMVSRSRVYLLNKPSQMDKAQQTSFKLLELEAPKMNDNRTDKREGRLRRAAAQSHSHTQEILNLQEPKTAVENVSTGSHSRQSKTSYRRMSDRRRGIESNYKPSTAESKLSGFQEKTMLGESDISQRQTDDVSDKSSDDDEEAEDGEPLQQKHKKGERSNNNKHKQH